ncbi:MAG: DUF1186 domain-containing protein [Acetobacteraceae bacterium]
MTLDEAMAALGGPGEDIPFAAMERVLDSWDVAGPRCLAMLDDYVHGRDMSERTERALFLVVHLLGEKGETAAFANLCALAGDPERGELVLGDATTETLPKILISTFNGDTAPLRSLAARADADSFTREGALMALAYLTHAGQVPEAEMRAYLAELLGTMQPQSEDFVWCGWVMAVGLLGYSDLTGQVEAVFARGFVDPTAMELKDFREDLQRATSSPDSLDAFAALHIAPMGRAADELAGWHMDQGDDEPPEQPYINPLRAIGRNDPCPCGSGKKYKKCCLV